MTKKDSNGKFLKYDGGKLRWDLMPEEALAEILKVFMYGAQKYSDWNWFDNGEDAAYSRLYNSAERHLKASKQGRDFDEESGLRELGHLGCNILMLMALQMAGKGKDDRRKLHPQKDEVKLDDLLKEMNNKNIHSNKAAAKRPKG